MSREERERAAAWWALVEGAAAALSQAAQGISDSDEYDAAISAANHYRAEARNLWNLSVLDQEIQRPSPLE